ncbi:dynein heavy chain, cytoplasmic-like [Mya arenaria]|uniref:dynein heavy chain, cytoplasmic-like n=1 Tax=Mya arenaria TaxID=6604 RepID=UPI0022E11176|nr:dynein heavy chain, cytoplasmic-like [Mya arenaria]
MSKEDKLKLLEEKAEKVATLSKRDMTELKSFSNPPTAIVDVLGATLKLLGEENTDWKNIVYSMSRNDGRSMQDLIADYDPDDVPDDKRAEAKKTLSQYDFEKVNRISVFTAVVYAWAVVAADF